MRELHKEDILTLDMNMMGSGIMILLICGVCFKVMANPYLRGRQYENNGSVLHQIFKDTGLFCNQLYFRRKCVVF